MADKELTVAAREVEVVHNFPDANGRRQQKRWRCTPDQAEKHIPTFQNADAARRLSAGEVSAIRDAASEYAKQRGS